MICIEIPGRAPLCIENLVLDLNGTIAIDGKISPSICKAIIRLSKALKIYFLTADTRGKAASSLGELPGELITLTGENTSKAKRLFLDTLDWRKTVAVGNGFNDRFLLKKAGLGIAVIGKEGACTDAILQADVAVASAEDALQLVLRPLRLQATLRR